MIMTNPLATTSSSTPSDIKTSSSSISTSNQKSTVNQSTSPPLIQQPYRLNPPCQILILFLSIIASLVAMHKVNGSTNGQQGPTVAVVTGKNEHLAAANGNYSALPFAPPHSLRTPINVPEKLLMGPGPSNASPRVLEATGLPVIGHMHQEFFQILDEIKSGLQYVFQTENAWTLCISGPGHLAMEAVLVNLLEPGEKLLVGVNGLWGSRAADTASRLGVDVHRLEKPLGTNFNVTEIEAALEQVQPKVLFLVHSESSTGIMQNLEGLGDLCRKYNCLLVVDAVASLGGVPFYMDKWKVDAMYTGAQKVLGAPPGIAPISFGPRAVETIKSRKTPVQSFLLDMNLLSNYWDCNGDGKPRAYHHTPPINLFYGLREALAQLATEKLENVWTRHAEATARLYAGLDAMGLTYFIPKPEDRLPTVTTIHVPPGVADWRIVTQYAMDKYMIEIAGGLGETIGKVYRVGVMGYNAYPGKVDRVLQALREGIEYAKLHGRL